MESAIVLERSPGSALKIYTLVEELLHYPPLLDKRKDCWKIAGSKYVILMLICSSQSVCCGYVSFITNKLTFTIINVSATQHYISYTVNTSWLPLRVQEVERLSELKKLMYPNWPGKISRWSMTHANDWEKVDNHSNYRKTNVKGKGTIFVLNQF